MCRNPDGSFTQAGIVAWGIECNLPDVPGGYVNIATYVCWVRQRVKEVRLDSGELGLMFIVSG